MSPFTIQSVRHTTSPRFPMVADFPSEALVHHPFRSRVSRPLAMAMAAMGVGGVGAQGMNFGSNQSSTPQLLGVVAMPVGPTVMELIDPEAAEALIARVFAEEGYTLHDEDVAVAEDLEAEAWDPERHVGFAILSAEDLPSDQAWAHFLEETLGEDRHLASDPRDDLEEWEKPLSAEQQYEVAHLSSHAIEGHVESFDGGHVLCLSPEDLSVREAAAWQTLPQTTIGERALALQRLEAQVREFIVYLRSQGI
ncbi:hypothetical protein JXA47_04405 [Candidatus Sumerlaeota bacterium]|nr:hypothetical protein [Candidatus Sumerlaeota bacterium]